jgi:hypothetical protein
MDNVLLNGPGAILVDILVSMGRADIGLSANNLTKKIPSSCHSSSSEVSSSSFSRGDWILTALLLAIAADSEFLGFGFAGCWRVKGRSRRGGGDWTRAAAGFLGRAALRPPFAMFSVCGTVSRALFSPSSSSSSSSSSVAEGSERSGVAKGGSSRSCIAAASSRLWSLSEAVGDAEAAEGMPLAFRFLGVEAAGLLGTSSCRPVRVWSAAEVVVSVAPYAQRPYGLWRQYLYMSRSSF